MIWQFKKYDEDSTQQNSSSGKFFKEVSETESLVREFIQNSLDAVEHSSKPVQVTINEASFNKRDLKDFLTGLEPHLKACGIKAHKETSKIKFIILEDFNTKGLERENQKNFFYRDNMTNKIVGGGSHGIGKAVFLSASKIKTFFGYSLFEGGEVFQGRSVLKSHKIGPYEYCPYGNLKIDVSQNEDLLSKLFTRKKQQKGLSLAIPYLQEDISLENIKKAVKEQFYLPIIQRKLEVEINKNPKINQNTWLDSDDTKMDLLMEYKTGQAKKLPDIKESQWKKPDFPKLEKDLVKNNEFFILSSEIEISTKNITKEKSEIILLIKKLEDDRERSIDFWRDNLLISKAISTKRPKGWIAVVIIQNSPLSKLLRELEDPGHTKWQIGSIEQKVKENYKNIKPLVNFIKKLPLNLIQQMKYQPIKENSQFFADYFPDTSSLGKKQSEEGKSSSKFQGSDPILIDDELGFKYFHYKSHPKGDGFTLRLKKEQNPPDTITVKTAYGTNYGNAFKNYDKRDFKFKENIKIRLESGAKSGEEISCLENEVSYSIKDESFVLSFTGFDPERELKIDIS